MGIAGLIISILGLVLGFVNFGVPILSIAALPVSIVGLILAAVAMKKNKGSHGVVIAGLVIGIIATVLNAIGFFSCSLCYLCALCGAGEIAGAVGA